MKTKREKLKEVLRVMKGEAIDFSAFDNAVSTLRKSLEDTVAIPTLDKVNNELETFRQKIDLTPLLTSLQEIRKSVDNKIKELTDTLEAKLSQQKSDDAYADSTMEQNSNNSLSSEIAGIRI